MSVPPTIQPHQGKNGRYTQSFLNQAGPGDARPTALQIVKDNGLEGGMKDKVFIVTGATGGIGLETGRALAATGGRVFLGVRDVKKAAETCKDFLEPGRVELLELDMGSLASVHAAVSNFLSKSSSLNVLINNAGIMACPEGRTVDGYETQLGVNYLGPFLLYKLLEKTLVASATPEFASRVVDVSSAAHHVSPVHLDNINLEGEYEPLKAYGNSKTAMVYMTSEIERRYGGQGGKLHGLSLMPGGIMTELQRFIPEEQKKEWANAGDVILNFLKSPAQGAATTLVAAVGKEWEGKGGVYLEDCQEGEPLVEGGTMAIGVAPHAFDSEKETKLYDMTMEILKLT